MNFPPFPCPPNINRYGAAPPTRVLPDPTSPHRSPAPAAAAGTAADAFAFLSGPDALAPYPEDAETLPESGDPEFDQDALAQRAVGGRAPRYRFGRREPEEDEEDEEDTQSDGANSGGSVRSDPIGGDGEGDGYEDYRRDVSPANASDSPRGNHGPQLVDYESDDGEIEVMEDA